MLICLIYLICFISAFANVSFWQHCKLWEDSLCLKGFFFFCPNPPSWDAYNISAFSVSWLSSRRVKQHFTSYIISVVFIRGRFDLSHAPGSSEPWHAIYGQFVIKSNNLYYSRCVLPSLRIYWNGWLAHFQCISYVFVKTFSFIFSLAQCFHSLPISIIHTWIQHFVAFVRIRANTYQYLLGR